MFDALKIKMLLEPRNRALRALLWFVIIFVPGGMLLLGLMAADTLHRRYRDTPRVAKTDLAGAQPLPRRGEGPASTSPAALARLSAAPGS
jgi:hypothetical protein